MARSSFDPSAVLGQLTEMYLKLPLVQKILTPLLIVGAFSGILFVANWANQPDYAVLYAGLDKPDASAVVERLKDMKVKYEIRGDGGTIAITPPSMVHEVRLALASEGLPAGGNVGLEIFDEVSLGRTTMQESTMYQRAMQGELERTIASLEMVMAARVHISRPEKTVFAKESSLASASVMLKLRPGAVLDKKQIRGIAHLVAGSVPTLEVENVNIVDVHGHLLTAVEPEAEELGIEATRLQYQKEMERSYVQRIEQMLAKVLGAGKVVARVTAELDFSSNEREEESYDPGGQVIRSERSVEQGTGSAARGGVPGVVSNLTDDANLLSPPGTGQQSNSRREQVKNYEVSRAVTRTSSPRGKLVRLSVAVLVDGKYSSLEGAAASSQPTYAPLDSEVMHQIETLVKNAVGFDPARGDTLSVENIPFRAEDTSLEEQFEQDRWWVRIVELLRYGLPWFMAALLVLFLVRPLVKFLITPTEAELDLERLLPTGIEELEHELEAERSKPEVPKYEPTIDLEQLGELIAENSRLVKENPHQAALLIRYWLNDGRL